MKNKLFILCVLSLCFFAACEKDASKPIHEPKVLKLPVMSAEVITKSNSFGIDLFTKTAMVESGNMMLSPLSASVALTMLLNGCSNNTYTQIQQMLGFDGMTQAEINAVYKSLVGQLLTVEPEVKLAIANAIWYRQGFEVKPPFLETMSTDFSAYVDGLDFSLPSALTTMNRWASDNTFGKIPEVLNEISPDAVMFLMNALYFKGTWTYQFDKSKTASEVFYLENGATTNVDMMHISLNANVYFGENYSALELNYGRTNYSMIILAPNGLLTDFYDNLNEVEWKNLTNAFGLTEAPTTKWEVSLPKFKFSYEKILNNQLISMGMVDAFKSNMADLSKISDADLLVSFVKQNTFVELNEEGTEAAAVTTIGIEITSNPQNNTFKVDKPFIFAIRERTTNTILFIGKVVNPSL